jgi:enoyl-CoA hydratase/carnithine racemase
MGMTLALHCDLRLAAKDTVLGYPEVRHGMISAVSALRLPQVIPSAQALELLLLARNISADEAWRWGLVNAVVDDVAAEAERWPSRRPSVSRCSRAACPTRSGPRSKPCGPWSRRAMTTRKVRPRFPAAGEQR